MIKKLLLDLLAAHPEIVASAVVKLLRDEADKIEKDPTIVTKLVDQLLGSL